MFTLSATHRRKLVALAHSLNPVIIIGKFGLSASVIDELDRGLLSHELIKVKVLIDDRTARETLLAEICQQLNAAPVKHLGKILIIYRPNPEDAEKILNKPVRKKKHEPRRTKRSFQA
tara:strand:- start:1076 stop:1429 length:354 start_codon:yes stop_codon:yes gene_type:complete